LERKWNGAFAWRPENEEWFEQEEMQARILSLLFKTRKNFLSNKIFYST
jgi:hypothetical protein